MGVVLELLDVDLPELLEGSPVEEHVVIGVVDVGGGDDGHLGAQVALDLALPLLLLLTLPLALDTLDRLVQLLVLLRLQLLRVLGLRLRLGLRLLELVLVGLELLTVNVLEALVLVSVLKETEELAAPADF